MKSLITAVETQIVAIFKAYLIHCMFSLLEKQEISIIDAKNSIRKIQEIPHETVMEFLNSDNNIKPFLESRNKVIANFMPWSEKFIILSDFSEFRITDENGLTIALLQTQEERINFGENQKGLKFEKFMNEFTKECAIEQVAEHNFFPSTALAEAV